MAERTWEAREVPILEVVADLEESGEPSDLEHIAEQTGLDIEVAARSVHRLVEAGFLTGTDVTSYDDAVPTYLGCRLLERGRRAVGQWPPTVTDALIDRLDALIAAATDPEERGRLERLKGALGDIGKNVVAEAVVAAATFAVGQG